MIHFSKRGHIDPPNCCVLRFYLLLCCMRIYHLMQEHELLRLVNVLTIDLVWLINF